MILTVSQKSKNGASLVWKWKLEEWCKASTTKHLKEIFYAPLLFQNLSMSFYIQKLETIIQQKDIKIEELSRQLKCHNKNTKFEANIFLSKFLSSDNMVNQFKLENIFSQNFSNLSLPFLQKWSSINYSQILPKEKENNPTLNNSTILKKCFF